MPNRDSIWYKSGDIFLGKNIRDKLETKIIETKTYYINYWSLFHFFVGFFYALIFRKKFDKIRLYVYGFLIHTLWEYWQVYIGMTLVHTYLGKNDLILDTVFFMLGIFVVNNFIFRNK